MLQLYVDHSDVMRLLALLQWISTIVSFEHAIVISPIAHDYLPVYDLFIFDTVSPQFSFFHVNTFTCSDNYLLLEFTVSGFHIAKVFCFVDCPIGKMVAEQLR